MCRPWNNFNTCDKNGNVKLFATFCDSNNTPIHLYQFPVIVLEKNWWMEGNGGLVPRPSNNLYGLSTLGSWGSDPPWNKDDITLIYSWISRFGFWSFDFGFWILDFVVWILEFWFWILDLGFCGLDFGVLISFLVCLIPPTTKETRFLDLWSNLVIAFFI